MAQEFNSSAQAQVQRAKGGRVKLDERVDVDFAPDALPQDTPIRGVKYAWQPPQKDQLMSDIAVSLGPDMTFSAPVTLTLNLNGLINPELLPTLKQRIVLQHVKTAKPANAKAREAATFTFDEVPSSFDASSGILTAQLAHFSDYVVTLASPERPKPWKLSANGGNVSLFRGSMNYAYPFSLPGLPDGLQPGLVAEYSSAGADVKADGQYVPGMHWSLGMGWSVQIPHISRQVRRWFRCSTNVSGEGLCLDPFSSGIDVFDLYTLNIGGQSYDLWHKGGGEYVTEDYSPIRVRRCNSTYSCASFPVVVSNFTNEYWQVWTADGTRYVFGVDQESESPINNSTGRVWLLRRVYSPLRDDPAAAPAQGKWTIQYNYEQGVGKEYAPFSTYNAGCNCWSPPYADDNWRRPSNIEYGYSTAGANWRNKIVFTYNWLWPRIERITMLTGNGTTNPTNLMQYQMLPVGANNGEITGIEARGWNGSAWAALPQTTFRYATFAAAANTSGDRKLIDRVQNGYGGEWQYSYIAQSGFGNTCVVNQVVTLNGLTGSAAWKRVDTYSFASPCQKSLGSPCINYGRNPIIDENDNGLIGFGSATHKTLTDVGGTVLSSDLHYFHQDYRRLGREYQTEIYNGDTNAAVAQSSQTVYGVFTGDGTFQLPPAVYAVRPINTKSFPGPINTAPFRQTNTAFYQSGSAGYTWLVRGNNAGRHLALPTLPASHVAEKRWKLSEAAQGGMTVALRACLVEKNSNGSWINANQRSTRITTATSCNSATENNLGIMGYAYPSNSSSSTITMYLCTGGTDYYLKEDAACVAGYTSSVLAKAVAFENMGTLSVGDKFGAASIVEDYDINTRVRYNVLDYAWNTTANIFKPIKSLAYDNNNTLLQETYINYDYNSFWGNVGLKGQTTKVTRGLSTTGVWASESYSYDAPTGNLVSLTNANAKTTTAAYHSSGHYLQSVTTPAVLAATSGLTSQYGYYGINESTCNAGGGQGPVGSLKCMVDPNNAVTYFSYDAAGRLRKTAQPENNNSFANPTQEVKYFDGLEFGKTTPFKIEVWQRDDYPSAGGYQPVMAFYDGVGQELQTRIESQNGTEQRVVNATYDALGRAQYSYVSAFETYTDIFNRPAGWDTRPKTTTSYDGLSRVTQTIGPDGALTKQGYGVDSVTQGQNMGFVATNGFVHSVTDANNHAKHFVTDGLGRTIRVREFTGTCFYSSGGCTATTKWRIDANAPDSGETAYTYNAQDQLIQVNDAKANVTTLSYDALGRKIAMNDPDMGAWSYGYDAVGNLTRQNDARGQSLSFAYDELNRVTDKFLNNVWVSWNRYDEGGAAARALGRRTRMGIAISLGTNWSNETYFYYDARGRMKKEHRFVDGGGWFDTSFDYDSADRVTNTTYPDGEVVTANYDAGGLSSSLQSNRTTTASNSNWLVNSASYNALGQLNQINFPSGLNTQYRYYGLNYNAGNTASYGRLRGVCVSTSATCGDTDASSNVRFNMAYAYDPVGNITNMGDRTLAQNHVYGYDVLDRLTSWTMNSAAQEGYAYDAIGNMTSKGGAAIAYPQNHVRPHAASTFGSNSYGYDANGNMTTRTENGVSYAQTWTEDNRLQTVTKNGQVTTYFYDADGNRVKRTDPSGSTYYIGNLFEAFAPAATPPPPTLTPIPTITSPPTAPATQTPTPTTVPPTVTAIKTPTPTGTVPPTVPGGPLDNFNRANGAIGGNWLGDTANYVISNNQLTSNSTDKYVYWNATFGADQQVSVKLASNPGAGNVIGLDLKAQGGTWANGVIEVSYSYGQSSAQVYYYYNNLWSPHGGPIPMTLVAGDRFGARAQADGTVTVLKNGAVAGTVVVAQPPGGWAINRTGQIGIGTNAPGLLLDDFDGGTVGSASGGHKVLARVEQPKPSVAQAAQPPGGWLRSYYYFNGQRVAMREQGTLPVFPYTSNQVTWLHSDHLGSASVTTDGNGGKSGELRYKPYGEVRSEWWSSGTAATDRLFTGQRRESANYVGTMMDYGARFYLPGLGRFASADTIVPRAGNPQSLNRYSYVYNRPMSFTDPSGHSLCSGKSGNDWWECRYYTAHGRQWDSAHNRWGEACIGCASFEDDDIARQVLEESGITTEGNWKPGEVGQVAAGVVDLATKISQVNGNSIDGFTKLKDLLGGSAVFHRVSDLSEVSWFAGGRDACVCGWGNQDVYFADSLFSSGWGAKWVAQTSVHELGHVMDYVAGQSLGKKFYNKTVNGSPGLHTTYWDDPRKQGYWEHFAEGIGFSVYGKDYLPFQWDKNGRALSTDQSDFINSLYK